MVPSSLVVALLVGVNMIPLFGVLFLGWRLFPIMVLYWLENGIIGLFNLPKIARAPLGGLPYSGPDGPAQSIFLLGVFGRGFLMVFFVFHYGIFWAVHGLFVFVLFGGFRNPFSGTSDPFARELPDW